MPLKNKNIPPQLHISRTKIFVAIHRLAFVPGNISDAPRPSSTPQGWQLCVCHLLWPSSSCHPVNRFEFQRARYGGHGSPLQLAPTIESELLVERFANDENQLPIHAHLFSYSLIGALINYREAQHTDIRRFKWERWWRIGICVDEQSSTLTGALIATNAPGSSVNLSVMWSFRSIANDQCVLFASRYRTSFYKLVRIVSALSTVPSDTSLTWRIPWMLFFLWKHFSLHLAELVHRDSLSIPTPLLPTTTTWIWVPRGTFGDPSALPTALKPRCSNEAMASGRLSVLFV